MNSITFDYLIIGGGMAGASVSYWLSPQGSTLLLEREDQPAYHSTGRSAALFSLSYGSEMVRALTRASHDFLLTPPKDFADHPLLSPRGVLMVAEIGQELLLSREFESLRIDCPHLALLDPERTVALIPALRRDRVVGSIYDPLACDLDVNALLQGFLRGTRASGGSIQCDSEVKSIYRSTDGFWNVEVNQKWIRARNIVNASGAWGDEIAERAGVCKLSLKPLRRSAFLFRAPADTAQWPMAVGLDESWYMKPDAGLLLGSPANADLTHPQDVQPDEYDIALGVHKIEEITNLQVGRPTHTWAGLRTFATDNNPIAGFDTQFNGFFWLVGQGGFGIQTAPALGRAAAAIVSGTPFPHDIALEGVSAETLSPKRLVSEFTAFTSP